MVVDARSSTTHLRFVAPGRSPRWLSREASDTNFGSEPGSEPRDPLCVSEKRLLMHAPTKREVDWG